MEKKRLEEHFGKEKGRLKNLTPEEKKAIATKGGIARQENKRREREMQDLARMMLQAKPSKVLQDQIKKIFPAIDKEFMNNMALLLSKVYEKALVDKDLKAFEILRDTAGYKPVDKSSITDSEGNNLSPPMIVVNAVKPEKKEKD